MWSKCASLPASGRTGGGVQFDLRPNTVQDPLSKMSKQSVRDSAKSNALASIRKDRRLPHNVFSGEWRDYLFFESYVMFGAGFIEVTHFLLSAEKSSAMALINLGDGQTSSSDDARVMFLNEDTRPEDYLSELKGDGSPLNWMFLMDRYVCASDEGSWSMYCKKENDVAAFAIGQSCPVRIYSEIPLLLNARSIRTISYPSHAQQGSFDFEKLVPSWKSALAAEYVPPA